MANIATHVSIPIGSMYGAFTYIWLIFVVNVGKSTIHGSYGIAMWRYQQILPYISIAHFVESSSFRFKMVNASVAQTDRSPQQNTHRIHVWCIYHLIYHKDQPNLGKYTIY